MKVNRSFAKIFLVAALLPMTISCEKGPNKRMSFGSKICVSIVTAETKSDGVAAPGTFVSERVVASVDGFDLIETVYENNIQPTAPVTKGSVVTRDVLNSFQLAAYATDEWYDNALPSSQSGSAASPKPAGLYFGGTDGIAVSKSGTAWNLASDHYWLNGIPISFWCWNGVTPTITDDGSGNYDSAYLADFQVEDIVTSQIDPIFAYNSEVRSFNAKGSILEGKDSGIDIHFYHALAAVNFDISEITAGNKVDNIKLSNIYSQGSCAISVSAEGVPQFSWTPDSDSAKEFSQTFESSDFGADGRQPLSNEKVFLMVPQELRDDATITVTFSGAESSPKTIHLPDAYTWEPGKYYTYKLQRTGDIFLELVGPAMPVDAHFGNAILKFGKKVPTGYSGEAAWLRFAAPVSSTEYAEYPGASATVDFAGLISELQGSGEKTHFISENGYYYTQAFIDEYYLAGESLSSFVNVSDRSATLTINNSATGTSNSVTISQKSIKSPYDLASGNPLGVETVEEDIADGGDPCANRNRDAGGKWRKPTLQEYYYLWYGNKTLANAGWSALSDAEYATTDTGVKGRYDGVASTWGPLSGTGQVRCVRDLGTGATPDPMYTINSTDRIVTMQNVGAGSLRATAKTGEYPVHTVTDDANLLPSKFKVATMNQKYKTGTYTKIDLPSDFCINLSMDTEQVPYISKGSSTTVVQGGKIKLNPYDEVFYFTATFVGAQGAKDVVANTVTITKDGHMSFDLEMKWNAGNNAYLEWSLQPHYVDPEGVDQPLGNPSVLYLVMNNSGAPGNIGANDDQSKRPGAKIVSNTINDATGSYKWYFSLKTEPASGQSYQKPIYDEFYTPVGVSDNGCADYYEEQAFDALNNKMIYPDLGKWRVPNQRELSIMLMNASAFGMTLDETPEPHYSSKTTYNSRPYYYYNGEYTTTGGNLTGKDFKIRCVRDID